MPLHEGRKPRIFVAEDDRAVLDLILTRLTLAGYETAYGRDGWEALSGITAYRPAAIILDINMPNLDGFGVLERLRKMNPPSLTPVMVLTARHAPDDVRQALSLGARDFLAKPFEDAQLLARIARLLRPRPKLEPNHEVLL
jgi:DNA-binding response OmpR family regulator